MKMLKYIEITGLVIRFILKTNKQTYQYSNVNYIILHMLLKRAMMYLFQYHSLIFNLQYYFIDFVQIKSTCTFTENNGNTYRHFPIFYSNLTLQLLYVILPRKITGKLWYLKHTVPQSVHSMEISKEFYSLFRLRFQFSTDFSRQ